MRFTRPITSVVLFTAMLAVAGTAPVAGQIPEGVEGPYRPSEVAERAISKIESPWCPGFMLSVCTAEESRHLRDSIHGLALEGWTEDEIVEWVLANHGEEYLAVPRGSGVGLWAWVMPPVFLILGVGVLVAFLRRFRTPEQPSADVRMEDLSEEDRDLLEHALREADRAEE